MGCLALLLMENIVVGEGTGFLVPLVMDSHSTKLAEGSAGLHCRSPLLDWNSPSLCGCVVMNTLIAVPNEKQKHGNGLCIELKVKHLLRHSSSLQCILPHTLPWVYELHAILSLWRSSHIHTYISLLYSQSPINTKANLLPSVAMCTTPCKLQVM